MSEITVVVNGTDWVVDATTTVAAVVTRLGGAGAGIAVARNDEVVPRSAWASTSLAERDRVEIVSAAAGG